MNEALLLVVVVALWAVDQNKEALHSTLFVVGGTWRSMFPKEEVVEASNPPYHIVDKEDH